VDLEGQLSNPDKPLKSLAPQGLQAPRDARQSARRRPKRSSATAPPQPCEAMGHYSNPAPELTGDKPSEPIRNAPPPNHIEPNANFAPTTSTHYREAVGPRNTYFRRLQLRGRFLTRRHRRAVRTRSVNHRQPIPQTRRLDQTPTRMGLTEQRTRPNKTHGASLGARRRQAARRRDYPRSALRRRGSRPLQRDIETVPGASLLVSRTAGSGASFCGQIDASGPRTRRAPIGSSASCRSVSLS
jgi:hypothetical protein